MPNLIDLTPEDYKATTEPMDLSGLREPQFKQDECRDREAVVPYKTLPKPELPVDIGGNAGFLRKLNPKKLNRTWQLIQQLNESIPLNKYGLPIYVYRPDMLDVHMFANAITGYQSQNTTAASSGSSADDGPNIVYNITDCEECLEAATIELTYDEGFPVTPNGHLFWRKLEFESDEAYSAFVDFLEMGGARQISDMVGYKLDDLREYYHLYYWQWRVKAFDLYQIAHHQKLKLQRMLSTEDDHYQMSSKLLRRLGAYLESAAFDDDSLTPEKAIGMMEKLVKIQRISAGLPANGEAKENNDANRRAPSSVNVLVQQLAQNGAPVETEVQTDVDQLLEDPSVVDMAQQLIIRQQQISGD